MGNNIYENWVVDDVQQGWWIAGRLLYGVLRDDVPEEKKDALFKKLSSVYWLYNSMSVDSANVISDGKYADVVEDMNNNPEGRYLYSERPRIGENMLDQYKYHDNPMMKKPLQDFQDGMKELAGYLDEKIKKGNFSSSAEANYLYLNKTILDMYVRGESFIKVKQSNPSLEYAYITFAGGVRVTQVSPEVTQEGEFVVNNKYAINDQLVFKALAESGLTEAAAGGAKVAQMTEEAKNGGDVSRQELIEEYENQLERMEKPISMKQEDYLHIQKRTTEKVFDNDVGEFTDGSRGVIWIKNDVAFRIQLLKAGYPISDLEALTSVGRKLSSLKQDLGRMRSNIENEQKKEKPNQNFIKDWNDRINLLSPLINTLEPVVQSLTDTVPLTEEVRAEKLRSLKTTADSLFESYGNNDQISTDNFAEASYLLGKRIEEPLMQEEIALLAGDSASMLEQLKEVDPKLVKSSDQFKAFREAMENLAQQEAHLDPENEESIEEYQRLAAVAAKAGREYLQFKTRQLNGAKRGHKRSDLEASRVKVVDAIITGLNERKIPGTDAPMLTQKVKSLETPVYKKSAVLFEPMKDSLETGYDSYIKLHTGKAAMNGTPEEMRQDLAKVIAAIALKEMDPKAEFSLDRIHKLSGQMGFLYATSLLDENQLREALQSEAGVRKLCNLQRQNLYGLDNFIESNGKKSYENYINAFRTLYLRMEGPEGKSEAYKKLFAAVKEISHLPKNETEAANVDEKKQTEKLIQCNFNLLRFAEEAVDENGRGVNQVNPYALDVLNLMCQSARLPGVNSRALSIQNRINDSRGAERLNDPKHLDLFEDYGYRRFKNDDKIRHFDQKEVKRIRTEISKEPKKIKESPIHSNTKKILGENELPKQKMKSHEAPLKPVNRLQ